MKILVLSDNYFPCQGGVAVFIHNLCIQLYRLGHQVDILVPKQKESTVTSAKFPYRIFRYSASRRLSSLIPFWKIFFLHLCNNYDMVFIGTFMTTHVLGVLGVRKIFGVPYVILSHGNDIKYSLKTKIDKLIARLIYSNAALMLGNSSFTAECVRQSGYKGSLGILNPGTDGKSFNPGLKANGIRNKYGLQGRRMLLTVSRLVAKKNIDNVLRALPIVIEKIPDLLYLVIGDGKERGNLTKLCEELDLCSYVHFLGYVDNSQLPPLYCEAELFIMVSRRVTEDIETFGISFIEASACRLPVIASKSGGIPDAVVDNETGLLVNPYNIREIAEAIIRLLTDKEYARKLGENGRRRVEQAFTWEKVGQRLEKYFDSIK